MAPSSPGLECRAQGWSAAPRGWSTKYEEIPSCANPKSRDLHSRGLGAPFDPSEQGLRRQIFLTRPVKEVPEENKLANRYDP